jgi:hypothetical protein
MFRLLHRTAALTVNHGSREFKHKNIGSDGADMDAAMCTQPDACLRGASRVDSLDFRRGDRLFHRRI